MESIQTLVIKLKRDIFSKQISQWFSNFGEVFDKATLKPYMTKETPYLFNKSGWW